MSLENIVWLPGFDFDRHTLRSLGAFPGLDGFLVASDDALGQYTLDSRPAGSDITSVTFRALFAGAPTSAARGIDFNTTTGGITFSAPTVAAPTLNNFLVEIEIAHTSPNLTSPVRQGLRVHVHDDLAVVWLTPNPLVGRQGSHNVHFTVLASFTDGVVGEISDWMLMQTTDSLGNPIPILDLQSSDPGITIDPADRSVKFVTVGHTSTITLDLGSSNPGIATATARCEAPWTTPVQAKFVDGAGESKRADVPNVLFLPDGFGPGDQTTFEQLVADIVRNGLARNTFLSPYNHLSRSINYWQAFVPSASTAVSVLCDVSSVRPVGATLRATPLEPPSKPPAAAAAWTLEQMMHEVGLPVRAQAALARADLIAQWQALYGPHVTVAKVTAPVPVTGGGSIEMWQLWQTLADRAYVNELSTAFAECIGGRQSAECLGSVPRQLLMSPKRMDPEDFDVFLRSLTFRDPVTSAITPLGDLWPPLEDTDPAHPKARGKDAGLVCIITRSKVNAGTNDLVTSFASSLGQESEHVLKTAVTGVFDVVTPVPFSARAPTSLVFTVAHETAHSFQLDDEYSGDCAHGQPTSTAGFGNTQLETDNGLVSAGPSIDSSKIKWLWPRIEKSGVLDAQPAPGAGANVFDVTLRAGHSVFAGGEFVRLRARPLSEHLQASFKFKVNGVAGHVITIEQVEGLPATITPGDFPAGSVLLKPKLAAPGGAELMMIHPDILAHIDATDGPLNAPLGSAARSCQVNFDTNPDEYTFSVQFATNLPPSMQTGTRAEPLWGSWIVGLYEGGGGFPCGVFHPTGACLMRSDVVPQNDLHGTVIRAGIDARGRTIPAPGTLYHFCPVCRYLMVDTVDPNKHPQIDADYDRIFPR